MTQIPEKIEKVLKTGIMWKFNPTCLALFIEGDTFEFKEIEISRLFSIGQDYQRDYLAKMWTKPKVQSV